MTTVLAAVIQRDGRILICQRRAEAPHPLKWEFPGGKREAGETDEQALMRELREELAIRAQIGPEICRYEYTYPGKSPILLIFRDVDAFLGEPRNLVFAQMQWVPRTELAAFDFLEGDREFLKVLAETNAKEHPRTAHPDPDSASS